MRLLTRQISVILLLFSDTSALSTLVDLAMISAGENDMEVDRISNFHTSCLNFAPLIFDIHEDMGFDELMEACQPVWKSVESDERLPEKLVSADWYFIAFCDLYKSICIVEYICSDRLISSSDFFLIWGGPALLNDVPRL